MTPLQRSAMFAQRTRNADEVGTFKAIQRIIL